MSFCPGCGEIVQLGALFCYNCNSDISSSSKNNLNAYNKNYKEQSNTYNLGIDLEKFVEDTILRIGYTNTEKRKKAKGTSGTLHEIDVLTYNGSNIVALECKNYTIPVGIKEIRDFKSKLDDLPYISEGIFVTNSRFTSEATNYANHYNIRLWDGKNLSKIHYLSSIGRLNKINNNSTSNNSNIIELKEEGKENDRENEITIDNALPVLIEYDTIKKVKLVNPQLASIVQPELTFFPFYFIKLSVKEHKKKIWLVGRKDDLLENESFIVDAIDGNILSHKDTKEEDVKPLLFSKNSTTRDEQIREYENDIIIETIRNTVPRKNYKIKKNEQYDINIQKSKYPMEAAERRIIEEIIDKRKVNYEDVSVSECNEIYVPKWSMIIKTPGLTYKRAAIASTNFIFRDEIDLCPKDSGKEVRKTYAICEMCGMAVCSKHIISNNHSKFCCLAHDTLHTTSNKKTSHIIEINEQIEEFRDNVQSLLLSTKIFQRKKKNDGIQEENEHTDKLKEETKKDEGIIEQSRKDEETNNFGRPIKW